MTWVARIPMRPDFCGCPPCPWCYAWAGDEPCDGVTKMARDLLGGTPTPVQVMQLEAGAQLVHANNLARKEADLVREREAREAEELRWSERAANSFLERKAKEVVRPMRKVDLRPVLDDLDEKTLEERTKEPEPVPERATVYTWASMTTAADSYKGYIEQMYRMQQAEIEKAMYQPFTFTGIDWAKEEPPPKAAASKAKWDGGDVKKKAEKEARKVRDAMLRR